MIDSDDDDDDKEKTAAAKSLPVRSSSRTKGKLSTDLIHDDDEDEDENIVFQFSNKLENSNNGEKTHVVVECIGDNDDHGFEIIIMIRLTHPVFARDYTSNIDRGPNNGAWLD